MGAYFSDGREGGKEVFLRAFNLWKKERSDRLSSENASSEQPNQRTENNMPNANWMNWNDAKWKISMSTARYDVCGIEYGSMNVIEWGAANRNIFFGK